MSIRLRQLALAAVIAALRLTKTIVAGLWWLLLICLNPLFIATKWVLRPMTVWLYSQYLKASARLKRSAFMQNKVLFVFGNRYFIHVLVVILTFFVASTNILQASTVQGTDVFAQDSALYAIVSPETEIAEDIIETGLIKKDESSGSYIETGGVMVATVTNLDPSAEPIRSVGEQLALAQKESALISSSVLQTSVGNRSGLTEYTVRDGDTVGTIAERFGLTVSTVLWANNLTSSSYIRPGDKLKILPSTGVLHTVVSGDTLEKIVEKYHGNLEETMRVNDIGNDHLVAVGAQLVVVDGTPPPPPTPTVTSYYASYSNSTTATYQASNLPNYVTAGEFNYPVGCRGAMTTYWGHAGRGRDLPCPSGTPIYASTEGTVKINSTGYGGGYGNSIDIYGPNGIMTRYAHMSAFAVNGGQYVSRGQVIGYVGSTGRSSGAHLHFEIHINGVAYDPINYLR